MRKYFNAVIVCNNVSLVAILHTRTRARREVTHCSVFSDGARDSPKGEGKERAAQALSLPPFPVEEQSVNLSLDKFCDKHIYIYEVYIGFVAKSQILEYQ